MFIGSLISLFSLLSSQIVMTSDDSKSPLNDYASKAWQIEAYSSAAPKFIARFASIIGGSGEILREGTNGWTCLL